MYSEIAPPDTDQLIKPSQVKSKRSQYAGKLITFLVTAIYSTKATKISSHKQMDFTIVLHLTYLLFQH